MKRSKQTIALSYVKSLIQIYIPRNQRLTENDIMRWVTRAMLFVARERSLPGGIDATAIFKDALNFQNERTRGK